MKFTLIINVKIPPIVGILTFISRINITSESYETEQIKESALLFCTSKINFIIRMIMKKGFLTSAEAWLVIEPETCE